MDAITQVDVKLSIDRIEAIVATGIFESSNHAHPLKRSAFIETLVCLRDLMYKSEKFAGHRVCFTDDINPSRNVKDITDLIKFVRDALCHLDSDNHIYKGEGAKISFNTTYGCGGLFDESEYEDDVCFSFGEHKLYLKRQILRAFTEAKSNLEPLLTRYKFS